MIALSTDDKKAFDSWGVDNTREFVLLTTSLVFPKFITESFISKTPESLIARKQEKSVLILENKKYFCKTVILFIWWMGVSKINDSIACALLEIIANSNIK